VFETALLFANDARKQLHNIFIQFGDNIQTARQLHDAVFAKFRDKSQLLLINFVCYLCVTLSSIFNDYVILRFSSA